MGEKIGTIAAIDKRRQCFTINLLPGVAINAGDGLCFFDANNQLRGCRIEKANGAMACVENISFLQNGMTLYRNFDNNFSKTLSKTTAQRIKTNAVQALKPLTSMRRQTNRKRKTFADNSKRWEVRPFGCDNWQSTLKKTILSLHPYLPT